MSIVGIILLFIIIIAIIITASIFIKNKIENEKIEDIKANILLIKGKCEVIGKTSKANNNTDSLKGKKVSEMKEDNIVSDFLSKNFIQEDKQDKYYVLSDDDLANMGLQVKNEKDSYYIVNYETFEVYITSGYKDKETNTTLYTSENNQL